MPAPQTVWTVEQALALPEDGLRYEVLDGELVVTPAPSYAHQSVLAVLQRRLYDYVDAKRLGWMLWAPADLTFSPGRLLQPDLFVVPRGEGPRPREWREVTTLLLVVEVLSPSTARNDRMRKRLVYQGHGIPEYWIVDLDARVVERWRPDDTRPEVLAEGLEWQPRAGEDALRIDLPAFFAEALD